MTPRPEALDPDGSDFVENPLRIRCIEVVELVTHYLEGALDPHDRDSVEVQLAGCTNCALFVAQIRLTAQLAAATQPLGQTGLPANIVELSALISSRKSHR